MYAPLTSRNSFIEQTNLCSQELERIDISQLRFRSFANSSFLSQLTSVERLLKGMNEESAPKSSKNKSSTSRPVLAPFDMEAPNPINGRFSFAEFPLAKHDNLLGRSATIQYNEISKSLASAVQSVIRAAGFLQREDVKAESKRTEWGTDGRIPTSLENWNQNPLRKPIPGFPFNCAFYPLARWFNSVPVMRGVESCWEVCVSCEDRVDFHGIVCKCFDAKVSLPTTPLQLLRTSEQWQRDLEQLNLQEPVLSGKTNWEVIREAHRLLKDVLASLEATVFEVRNKYELSRTSVDPNGSAYVSEDSDDIDLYEALYKSFKNVSSTASGRCFQALDMVADCMDECQDLTEYAPALLRHAVLDLVDMYSRCKRAHGILVCEKRMSVYLTQRNSVQDERVFGCVWKQIEFLGGRVISIQNQILQAALMQQDGTETLLEKTSKLEFRYQQSWAGLNKVGKQAAMLCPIKKERVFLYLLEIFVDATGELSQHPKQLPASYDANCEERVSNAAASCHKIVLQSLMQLFENAEEAGLQLQKEGLVAAFDFVQIADASRIYSVTLTLLLSLIRQQSGNTASESQELSQILRKYENELRYIAKPCLEVIHRPAIENAATTSDVNESTGGATEVQDDVHSELVAPVGIGEELGSSGESTEPQNDHDEEQVTAESTSGASEETTPAAETPPSSLVTERRTRPSVFERRPSHPSSERPDEALVPVDIDSNVHGTFGGDQAVEAPLQPFDPSLGRKLPPMPSTSRFDRVKLNAMTFVKDLGEGSSGQVHLMAYDNNLAAVKESTCKDPGMARDRLERECTVHQRINNHSNIVRFLGRAVKTEAGEDLIVGIITDWCKFGDLSNAIKDAAWIQELDSDGQDISYMSDRIGYQLYKSWIKRLEVVAGIAAGMTHMHHHQMVHRDLTSSNVLLDSIDQRDRIGIKICDFERGYFLENCEPIQRTSAPTNSVPWMGPEVLKHEKYGLQADVYSIGTILWQLINLENPWTYLSKKCFCANEAVIQCLLFRGEISLSISEEDAPDGVPEFPELVRLVKCAWAEVPDERPTMAGFHEEVKQICARMKKRVRNEPNQTSVAALYDGNP